jgi:hypothetical protein
MAKSTWFTDSESTKTRTTTAFPPDTLPVGATPALIGPIVGSEPLYLHNAEGARSFDTDDLLALKFPHHTAEQFATLVWQSDDWNERVVQVTIEAGEINDEDLATLTANAIVRLDLGSERKSRTLEPSSMQFVDGPDLSSLRTLQQLHTYGVALTDDHLSTLGGPARLDMLNVDGADMTPAVLPRFRNLGALFLNGDPRMSSDLSFLANHRGLRGFGMRFADLTSDQLHHISANLRPFLLDIAYNPRLGPDLSGLAGMPGLQMLDLAGTAVDGSSIATLRGMSLLTRLTMQSTNLGDTDLSSLRNLPQITNLDVAGTDITDVGLRIIVDSLPNLRYLDIRATNVTEQGTAALSQARNLFSLGLDGTLLTVSLAERLKADTNLDQVYVCPPYINDDPFETGEPIDIIGAAKYMSRPL